MTISRTLSTLLVLSLATFANRSEADDPLSLDAAPVLLGALDDQTFADIKLGEKKTADDSHPLLPTLRIARDGYQRILRDVRDYTCVMIKREEVNGKLRGPERIFAKVRHEQAEDGQVVSPFGVYMKFDGPGHLRNREVLFVQGRNDGRLLVRNGGRRLAFLTLSLHPTSAIAMSGNRYPITEFGILRLVERMILLGRKELAYEECEVEIRDDVQLEGQVCTRIQVTHPVRRPHFQYHLVKIYLNNELQLPVRFESYGWPAAESNDPVLKEEYTYRDLKLNVGLTDADFQRDNPAYGFR